MARRRKRKARSTTPNLLAGVVIVLVLVGAVLYLRSRHNRTLPLADAPGLPVLSVKPTPKEITFRGCPPDGDGGDPQLNLLKNRVDEGDYVPAEFAAVEKLQWPRSVERLPRHRWSSDDAASVARYEGIPLSIEGYLAGAREQGPESTNCHGADPAMLDFHLWLVGSPDEDRSASIVVEATPRVRASHAEWGLEVIEDLVQDKDKVRISGWLMLDPEHPDQVGRTRGTLWEIHPIMRIEVNRRGVWATLESEPGR
jgi:hypothetical protein